MTKSIKSIINYSGVDSSLIRVQCHITSGLPSILIIGYASKAVDEAKERLRAGFANSSLPIPKKRITLNLAPADIPKDSSSLDLAMAVAILSQSHQIPDQELKDWIFLGEINLDGSLSPVKGVIGRILQAKRAGYTKFYLPDANLKQAMLIPGITVKAPRSLKDTYLDLNQMVALTSLSTKKGYKPDYGPPPEVIDLAEIIGQPVAKRALEIAAAGRHNLLLYGPPGTGKSMLAKALWGILPPLDHSAVLSVTHLHSLGTSTEKIIHYPPFRSPHHTSSAVSLIGGGSSPKPGEVSLAHQGVLFLDELPEFRVDCLEALRQPLEDGEVTISRVKDSATYPSDFMLIATQNPCPCGYYGTPKPCKCSAAAILKYQKKVSGPVLDRIDLHLSVHTVDHKRLLQPNASGESHLVRKRVEAAYGRQRQRFAESRYNSSMSNREIRELAYLLPEAKDLLDTASQKLQISARAYVRTVKVARTIADLDGSSAIEPQHISEALQYRQPASHE